MESEFQFRNPILSKLDYSLKDKVENQVERERTIQLQIKVNVRREPDNDEAIVSLELKLGDDTDECPYKIVAVEEARFRWSARLDDGTVERLLNQNAPALLISYLRPVIFQITAASPYGAYSIPFINFVKNQ